MRWRGRRMTGRRGGAGGEVDLGGGHVRARRVRPGELAGIVERDARIVADRLATRAGLFARTVTLKVKLPDFSILSRSQTLHGATDRPEVIGRLARALLDGIDVRAEASGCWGWAWRGSPPPRREELFEVEPSGPVVEEAARLASSRPRWTPTFTPGADVWHAEYGDGWVWVPGSDASRCGSRRPRIIRVRCGRSR